MISFEQSQSFDVPNLERSHAHAQQFYMLARVLIFLTLLLNGFSLVRIEDGDSMMGSSGNLIVRYLNNYMPTSAKQHLLALKSFHNITLILNIVVMLSILTGFIVI